MLQPNKFLKGIVILAHLFFLLQMESRAQEWRTGILGLNNGEHIIGDIQFSYDLNSVQIRFENETKTYSASQFYSFRLVKNDLQPERNFFVLNFTESSNKRATPHIFESVYNGEVSLMVRAYYDIGYKKTRYTNNLPNNFEEYFDLSDMDTNGQLRQKTRAIRTYVIYYDQFLAWKDGRVIKLDGFNKKRINAIGDKKKELRNYVNKDNLDLKNHLHMAMLVSYYNDLLALDSN